MTGIAPWLPVNNPTGGAQREAAQLEAAAGAAMTTMRPLYMPMPQL